MEEEIAKEKDNEYMFCPAKAYDNIMSGLREFIAECKLDKAVVGISGGKDSTLVAKIAVDVLGADNVIGVLMPCGEQSDIQYSFDVVDYLGIKSLTVNIKEAFDSLVAWIDGMHGTKVSKDTKINLQPRLRMATLFAVAQSNDAFVLCTTNLSEATVGYGTFGGDDFGSYAPLKYLTSTEVVELGTWLDLPKYLVEKPPSDGLQGVTDEEKFGFTYKDLDDYIRTGVCNSDIKNKIDSMYRKNKFKSEIVRLSGPRMPYANFVAKNNTKLEGDSCNANY